MSLKYVNIYNNLIRLTTNKNLYKGLSHQDTFEDRLVLFLIHFAFFLTVYNKKEDKKLQNDLLNDSKEIAEHLMLLDLGRNDISRVSEPGTVKVTDKMYVEYFSHVMHIVSNIEARLKKKMTVQMFCLVVFQQVQLLEPQKSELLKL